MAGDQLIEKVLGGNGGKAPWWTRYDYLISLLLVILVLAMLGIIPTPLADSSREHQQIIHELSDIANTNKVMCIGQAKTDQAREACIRGLWGDK